MSLLIIGAGRPGTGERWLAFLRNHREVIAAMDFFTVPNSYVRRALLLLHHQR